MLCLLQPSRGVVFNRSIIWRNAVGEHDDEVGGVGTVPNAIFAQQKKGKKMGQYLVIGNLYKLDTKDDDPGTYHFLNSIPQSI